jgi:hypothetical protein
MTPSNDSSAPIVVKALYIKLIFLIDREKHQDNPVFTRQLRRSGEEFPIYDSSIFYQFTQFAPNKPPDHEWRFTSSRGQVDALQLHPFDLGTFHADPAKRTIQKSVEGYLRPTPDSLLVVCHNYNGFQREDGEWAGVRAANDTGILRLAIDFSSVMTVVGKEIFFEHPSAYWVHELERDPEKRETPLEFEYDDGRIFSVSQTDVPKKDVIAIRYKTNWDSLVIWGAYHENKRFIPRMLF